jgi:hypothetical protein
MYDLYTKAVLTVIAVALSAIALQHAGVVSASAQGENAPTPVSLCGGKYVGCDLGTADNPLVVQVIK